MAQASFEPETPRVLRSAAAPDWLGKFQSQANKLATRPCNQPISDSRVHIQPTSGPTQPISSDSLSGRSQGVRIPGRRTPYIR